MTQTRYLLARFAQAFGIHRKNQRMNDAAGEMHLLREAEAYLGSLVWERVENIETLSVEYWNLRKLRQERDALLAELRECEARLNAAHEERSTLLNSTSAPQQKLMEERKAITVELEELARQRDEIVAQAREVRRSYDGLQTKYEVLSREEDPSESRLKELENVRARLAELKSKFSSLKAERSKIGARFDAENARLDALEQKYQESGKDLRSQATQASQLIGDVNRDMSTLRSELGPLDVKINHLHSEIGRHVSRHVTIDPACAEAARPERRLVEIMAALRRSVLLNHRLAGMS